MSDTFHDDHCSRWSGIPQTKQTEFTRRAVGLLVTAFRTGVYNLPVLWKRVDWRYGNGVSFILGNRPALASWDFNQLTRLVIGAHDECIRVEVEPHGFGYLKINMWPRKGRDGQMSERHPSIEDAISDYRTDNPAPQPSPMGTPLNICDKDGGGELDFSSMFPPKTPEEMDRDPVYRKVHAELASLRAALQEKEAGE